MVVVVVATAAVVVAAAGGVVLSAANRRLLAGSGVVVWLRAPPGVLARRVGDGAGRPLLGNDPERALVELEAVRRPLYESVATITLDVDSHRPEQVLSSVIEALARFGIGPEAPR